MKSSDKKTLVFVYGSLKQGYWNHGWLGGARFVGKARSQGGFTLFAVASFPGMIASSNTRHRVNGEVYECSPGILRGLDRLEGEGFMYKRQTIEVILKGDTKPTEVQTYIWMSSIDRRSTKRLGASWPGKALPAKRTMPA